MTAATAPVITPEGQLFTVQEIMKETGRNRNAINYALISYPIEPARRIGITRLFNRAQVEEIKAALRRVGNRF